MVADSSNRWSLVSGGKGSSSIPHRNAYFIFFFSDVSLIFVQVLLGVLF